MVVDGDSRTQRTKYTIHTIELIAQAVNAYFVFLVFFAKGARIQFFPPHKTKNGFSSDFVVAVNTVAVFLRIFDVAEFTTRSVLRPMIFSARDSVVCALWVQVLMHYVCVPY